MPRGEKNQRRRGGFFETQVVGNLDGGPLGRGHQFGVAAVDAVAEDGVLPAEVVAARGALVALPAAHARREQHAPARFHALAQFAHLDHFAGDVASQNVRHGKLHAGNAGPHEQVQMIQRAGAHAQQDLIGFDLRVGNIFVDQHFRRAVLMDAGSFHASQYIGVERVRAARLDRGSLLFVNLLQAPHANGIAFSRGDGFHRGARAA